MLFKFLILFIGLFNVFNSYALKFSSKPTINKWISKSSKSNIKLDVKPDLFSDDLFEEDEEPAKKDSTKDVSKSKKTYLNEDWKLSPTDQKEFKGFNKKSTEDVSLSENEKFPCFALMYKLRREYVDTSIDAMIADHNGHCLNFKRLINSELITLGNSKGLVLLWAGLSSDDKVDTKAEIMSFLEEDPLIVKDVIEKWDIIDLEKKDSKELPSVVAA